MICTFNRANVRQGEAGCRHYCKYLDNVWLHPKERYQKIKWQNKVFQECTHFLEGTQVFFEASISRRQYFSIRRAPQNFLSEPSCPSPAPETREGQGAAAKPGARANQLNLQGGVVGPHPCQPVPSALGTPSTSRQSWWSMKRGSAGPWGAGGAGCCCPTPGGRRKMVRELKLHLQAAIYLLHWRPPPLGDLLCLGGRSSQSCTGSSLGLTEPLATF